MEIETPRHDTNYNVAKNRIEAYGCARIFRTDKSPEMVEKLKIAFPNYFIWDRKGNSIEFVNLDDLVEVFKYKNACLLNFRTDTELVASQFMVNSDIYNDLIKTLEERSRYDILLNLNMVYIKGDILSHGE